jgi:hypothetical protein
MNTITYKPASDPATIAQGLREGWIVPAKDSELTQSNLFGPTYDVIYADPPWQYGSGGARGGQYGALDYPTMATADICALPVSRIAADDAALCRAVIAEANHRRLCFVDVAEERADALSHQLHARFGETTGHASASVLSLAPKRRRLRVALRYDSGR